ncbi:adenosylmethionine decarboxylase 1 [Capsaspora owczarzaki ATCC 30864]|uniref:Adenosylmethionine decarboxylase 1 n=1 Tax=Capsaspora owczarzaki (strain ATCC 30864) TaxID=595528 RepID=A0A0D2WL10_CAPO3|nr:adenosylmethionine decarboxylase 1 [Capsaspora owczarzaki ATCC 30864]KJE91105.1 adenosylmethionine decarboxylase 1 [Capsaspora owczarzaki ATCC 30864]|eukprot:XP_004349043.1 adenosylmethionine decarboxylase 1 [Capsaspora owczarzaki ATCC 30864]
MTAHTCERSGDHGDHGDDRELLKRAMLCKTADADADTDADTRAAISASPAAPEQPESPEFFEGTEKLLEIEFADSPSCDDRGLRAVTADEWQVVLRLVNCTICRTSAPSSVYNAYVLSESSMFVARRKIVIKTCGTTRLLPALPEFMRIARERCGLSELQDLFFSRKSFLRPEEQPEPHRGFDEEVDYLRSLFGAQSGVVISRDDWHVFCLNPISKRASGHAEVDQTLEVLMTNLDPVAMQQFYRTPAFVNDATTDLTTGVAGIIPGTTICSLLFDPCGYSANGIFDGDCAGVEDDETTSRRRGRLRRPPHYFTIHVTPQPECSFVSFETNAPLHLHNEIVARVLRVFRPSQFSVSVFATRAALGAVSRCPHAGPEASNNTGDDNNCVLEVEVDLQKQQQQQQPHFAETESLCLPSVPCTQSAHTWLVPGFAVQDVFDCDASLQRHIVRYAKFALPPR